MFQRSKRELNKISDKPVKVIPALVHALGTTPNILKQRSSDREIDPITVESQKTTILYSARLLRNAFEV